MDIEDLRARWLGKCVRTDRVVTLDEYCVWCPGDSGGVFWYPGFSFGGEGVVRGFVLRGGRVWLQVDWGFEWVVDNATVITEVSRDGT